MVVLLMHDKTVFDELVIYATGHSYIDCEFNSCTFVLKGFPFVITGCTFRGCVWHLDFVIHNREDAEALSRIMLETVIPSVPSESKIESGSSKKPKSKSKSKPKSKSKSKPRGKKSKKKSRGKK